ncbi:Hypothetical predicted protein [Pelobates cultripes]|uniref:Uncharacterized protein n=1 Tax=Pelobates cultripes TaxID=61616 RepID=A0AAD1W7B6_PELCU|nr:Hypothetical predicted protein [Pelobates cultripes]
MAQGVSMRQQECEKAGVGEAGRCWVEPIPPSLSLSLSLPGVPESGSNLIGRELQRKTPRETPRDCALHLPRSRLYPPSGVDPWHTDLRAPRRGTIPWTPTTSPHIIRSITALPLMY